MGCFVALKPLLESGYLENDTDGMERMAAFLEEVFAPKVTFVRDKAKVTLFLEAAACFC